MRTVIILTSLALLTVPVASAAAPAAAEGPTEWYCGEPGDLLYRECVLVATVFTAVCEYVMPDPRRCPQ